MASLKAELQLCQDSDDKMADFKKMLDEKQEEMETLKKSLKVGHAVLN